LKGSLISVKHEDYAWLNFQDTYIVVGSLAREFDAEDRLRDFKYESAIYKVLAAIGTIADKHWRKPKSFRVTLGILLPWNEYNDRSLFAERLRELGKSYRFRSSLTLSLKFNKIEVRPEGYGLFSTLYRTVNRVGTNKPLYSGHFGILMLGHRNVSGLYFERGRLVKGDSPLLGFSNLCDRVVELSSRSDRERVALALNSAVSNSPSFYSFTPFDQEYSSGSWQLLKSYPCWEETEEIEKLCFSRENKLRSAEAQRLGKAIRSALDEYSEKLTGWLRRIFPETLDGLIISGGARLFLEPCLEQYFNYVEIFENNSGPPAIEDVDRYRGRIEIEGLNGGKVNKVYNRRSLRMCHEDLAFALKLPKDSPLTDRLLDVYELSKKL
jgi:hypothetical protein